MSDIDTSTAAVEELAAAIIETAAVSDDPNASWPMCWNYALLTVGHALRALAAERDAIRTEAETLKQEKASVFALVQQAHGKFRHICPYSLLEAVQWILETYEEALQRKREIIHNIRIEVETLRKEKESSKEPPFTCGRCGCMGEFYEHWQVCEECVKAVYGAKP